MKITAVPANQVHMIWPEVGHLVDKPIDVYPGHFTTGDLFLQCASDRATLWVVYEKEEESDAEYIAILISTFKEEPLRKIIAVNWIGGSRMSEWLPMAFSTINDFGKENGCTFMEGYGRKAWEKVLNKAVGGWTPIYIAYERELT